MIRKLFAEQRALMVSGALFLALFVGLAIVAPFDSVEVMGINRWIKPMKFASSIAIYLWTLAVFLYFIDGRERAKNLIARGTIAMMIGEIFLIVMQAARGTTSHFNMSSAFDGAVFSLMGLLITINTLLAGYLLFLYFRAKVALPDSIVWGIRFGIVLLILASVEGGFMSAHLGHGVGAADGGAGLTFVNWSTRGGDLRVAHFVGLHALQLVPLFAWTLERFRIRAATLLTTIFAALYFAAFTGVFIQALLGRPLLSTLFAG
ncbi:MAG: hypothetical protein JSS81_29855 [Acidobacteria bacterium]|nr:hypothetical protein [Acidobacteriota bacterium]